MRVVFAGGGTGGHFYPLLAVAESLQDLVKDQAFAEVKLYYFSTDPYNKKDLDELGVEFRSVVAGKLRIYASLQNFFDVFKMGFGILQALWKLFAIFPDVVFAKGGFASFPTIVAAWILRIPIIIHESDSVPGRANKIASRMAYRIAVSYREAAEFFPKEKTAHTGQPIRRDIATPIRGAGFDYMSLEPNTPVIAIFGGSQGAKVVNEALIGILPELVEKYQIVHQTGKAHFDSVKETAKLVLGDNQKAYRYHPYPFLEPLAYQMVGGIAKLVITRAGSSLFEFAAWGVPAIAVPITKSNGDHQRKNAYNYARTGAGQVIEEANLTPHILVAEIERILQNDDIYQNMQAASANFYGGGAAQMIAEEILRITLSHERK